MIVVRLSYFKSIDPSLLIKYEILIKKKKKEPEFIHYPQKYYSIEKFTETFIKLI